MPLSNTDNPVAEKPKPPIEVKPSKAAERSLARASESTDAAVHNLLAKRSIALKNGDAVAVQAADDALAELGFAV